MQPTTPNTMHPAMGPMPAARADAATVVFMGISGPPITIVDDQLNVYGEVSAQMYFVASVPPGRRMFVPWESGASPRPVSVDLAAGRQYYIHAQNTGGAFGMQVQLTGVRAADAERVSVPQWLATHQRIEPDPQLLDTMQRTERRRYESVVRRGLAAFRHYSGSDLERHTLAADDGDVVSTTVAAPPPSSGGSVAIAMSGPVPSAGNDPGGACPRGQLTTVDTANHCCWPAQAWAPSRNACVGVPQCPAGFEARGESCVETACPPGQAITADTQGHCCWLGQAWATSRAVCVGVPSCPAPLRVAQESCVP